MKCFSVYPEYAEKFLPQGGKQTSEFRTFPIDYRGDVLIAVTRTPETRGFIFSHGIIYDCHEIDDGMWAWEIKDLDLISPLPVRGHPGLYDIDYTLANVKPVTADEFEIACEEADAWLHKGAEELWAPIRDRNKDRISEILLQTKLR